MSAVDVFLKNNAYASALSAKMLEKTSTKFVDWIDHIVLPDSIADQKTLRRLGLTRIRTLGDPKGASVYKHRSSYLFPIILRSSDEFEVAIKPESIDDFLQSAGIGASVEGKPFSEFRKAAVSRDGEYLLSAVERRGYDGFVVRETEDTQMYLRALSAFFCRKRRFATDSEGMESAEKTVGESLDGLASARASDAFFRAERVYWQSRNRAGQIQKSRQDTLGLGWGNHDHHTYRSSREAFTSMIRIFERLGYTCREKYYAGDKAGWGAQILEHEVCNIVIFTDVDLEADEAQADFSHEGFGKREGRLGTVGLWVGLHGESILQAGMHHLEARFDFKRLSEELPKYGAEVMQPFSHFEFLKQAFTAGDRWEVDAVRLRRLLGEGYITKSQYDEFLSNGAIGSHMENLERDQGFKGFNRASVTKIIMETDPRKQHFSGA